MLVGQLIPYRHKHTDTLFYRQLVPNKNMNVLAHVGTSYNSQCWNKKLNVAPIHSNHYHKLKNLQNNYKIINL